MKVVRLALRSLVRDWRAGELRILAVAVVIAVTSVTAVGFFADRARLAMESTAGELLAADMMVSSPYPLAPEWEMQARALGLKSARTLSFVSVVVSGDTPQLTEVKAVGAGYPLRGTLRLADKPFGVERKVIDIPPRGSAWADARLLAALGLDVGDHLELGATRLRIDAVLAYEPDRGGDVFTIGPRLMLNLADVAATGLLQPGSRIEYRLLVAGKAAALRRFRTWLAPRLPAGARIQDVRDARPELRTALARAEQYLGLAALLSAVLAGVAIATAARRFAARHLDAAAIMRCLGSSGRLVLGVFAGQMLMLAIAASLIGSILGYAAQAALAFLLRGFIEGDLPAPTLMPVAMGLGVGVLLLLGFALPPIARLRTVPPLRVIRRELGPLPASAASVYLGAASSVTLLVAWQAADTKLAAFVLLGLATTLVLLTGFALVLIRLLAAFRGRAGVALRFGVTRLSRHKRASVVQVVAFGVAIMAMLLLSLVRADLLGAWRKTLPADAPNQFLINIQPQQVAPLAAFIREHTATTPAIFPMVRGRLVEVNQRPVSPDDFSEPRAQRLMQREFNLSWTDSLPPANRVVAGTWWQQSDSGKPVCSVEQGLAETLGLRLGDRLTFSIGGENVTTRITSLRAVDWDSFRVNFFVLMPPRVLENYPASYITSFHLAPARRGVAGQLVRAFPNVTVIDVDAIMAKVREVMDRASAAVEFVFVFSVLAGITVLIAAIQATRDEREQEAAIMRTLGASRRLLLAGLGAEFVVLGLFAGVVAAAAATLVGYVLATQIFNLPYQFNGWIWIAGMLSGALGISSAGLLLTHRVVRQPPIATLRTT